MELKSSLEITKYLIVIPVQCTMGPKIVFEYVINISFFVCRQSREPIQMPKMEMPKIEMPNMKKMRMPSPGEIVHGYLNSDFHSKRLIEILAMKIRLEISMNNSSR